MDNKAKSKKHSKLEDLARKSEEYLKGWQRAQADYQNLKKEVAAEKASFAKFAKINFILELLPLYNNLQTAFQHLPQELQKHSWVRGMVHIKDQFSALLQTLSIEKIPTKNQKFDASLHEAVAQENNNKVSTGVIIREVTAGYKLDGEVLLPAKVVVAE